MAMRDVLDRAGAGFDLVVRRAIFFRGPAARARSQSESLGPADRIRALAAIHATWDPQRLTEEQLYPHAPAIVPRLREVRSLDHGHVLDATWPSAFTPLDPPIRDRYASRPENATAAARLFLHDTPRPAAVLIHGYRAGHFGLEERAWPIRWLYERGLDVAIFVLPFHGVRAASGKGPFFPSSDPRITNDGFRQAIWDLGALAAFLRARGAPHVGVMGMSLGGYTAALAATVQPDWSFVVPIIPLASLADSARDGDRYVGTHAEKVAQHEALTRAHLAVSPLARPARIASDRLLVLGATGDRITPIDHARRLAAHLGAPIEELSGGHLLQFWRGDGFRAIGRLLGRLGLLAPR